VLGKIKVTKVLGVQIRLF